MLIKRFEGPSIQDVVRRIRAELGPDAIVLSQRTRKAGRSWLGIGGELVVEVTAAVDRDRLQRPVAPGGVQPAATATDDRTRGDESWRPLQLTRALLEPLEDEIRSLKGTLADVGRAETPPSLAAEVEELRELARELSRQRATRLDDPAARVFLRAGLEPELAQSLADDAALRAREGQPENDARFSALVDRLEDRLAAPRFDLPRSQLVIGAPGVGKTTTLAKLADRYPGGDLTVLSADARRPGASARLRAAARELGVRFEELRSVEELGRRSLRRRTILVDTPGLVSSAPGAIADLQHLRSALGPRADVQLVVSATTKESVLRQQLLAGAACAPDSLVVTRVDETRDLAGIINLVLQPGAPRLAWLGCGQNIPDDLEVADARTLARTILEAAA